MKTGIDAGSACQPPTCTQPVATNDKLLALLADARPFVEAGLYLSEKGSKSQADIFRAAETLQHIDAALGRHSTR